MITSTVKTTIVTCIHPDGERSEIFFVNSFSPFENLKTLVIQHVFVHGNILYGKERERAEQYIEETAHFYMFRDHVDNYYLVRK